LVRYPGLDQLNSIDPHIIALLIRIDSMYPRTRIKICGLSRPEEFQAAALAGADAVGLVFYPASPRYVAPEAARELVAAVPPYITSVGLFVNQSLDEIRDVIAQAPVSCLQFHGDETLEECCAIAAAVNRPFIRALRVRADMKGIDLLKCEQEYRDASRFFSGLLLDAFVDGYGGGGKVFDWSLVPDGLAPRIVLSGGLNVQNAADAIARIRPFAVDVSSGVEVSKGVKDISKIHAFAAAVRAADASFARGPVE
jgi:phosphoribosylanthranilate isomerase